MMHMPRLSQYENTKYTFDTNHLNRLTPSQIGWLSRFLQNESLSLELARERVVSAKRETLQWGFVTLGIALFMIYQQFFVTNPWVLLYPVLIPAMIYCLKYTVTRFLAIPALEESLVYELGEEQRKQQKVMEDLRLAPNIGYLEGRAGFITRGNEDGQVRYLIGLFGQEFSVAHDLWSGLRPYAEYIGAHVITIPGIGMVLISVQPVEPIMPDNIPSDAELAQVVGISDDGELVYDDELTDSVQDGRITRLDE